MSLTRRQLIARGAGIAGGVLAHGLMRSTEVMAATCTKSWVQKNCTNIQPSLCGGSGCTVRWYGPGGGGQNVKTAVQWSPAGVFYAQCMCDPDASCICQVQLCVCNGGVCSCKLWCDCV
jgi:hypothetical protein